VLAVPIALLKAALGAKGLIVESGFEFERSATIAVDEGSIIIEGRVERQMIQCVIPEEDERKVEFTVGVMLG